MVVCLYHRKITSYYHTPPAIPVSCTVQEKPPLGHVCTIKKTHHSTIVSYPTRLWAPRYCYCPSSGRNFDGRDAVEMSGYDVAAA